MPLHANLLDLPGETAHYPTMPQVTYNYVYFAAGPHQRQPRLNSGPGGFTLIQSFLAGDPTGGTFSAGPLPQTLPAISPGGPTFNFAFVNYSGKSSTVYNSPPLVHVGKDPIDVLVVYVPVGGSNGPPSYGATIDSFNETTGILFDDTFATVSGDPDGTLSLYANKEGYVDTTSSTETITALSPTSPTDVDFGQWVLLYPPVTYDIRFERVGGVVTEVKTPVYPPGITSDRVKRTLTVDSGTSVSALAFYKAPPSPKKSSCEELEQEINRIIDAGVYGPPIPTGDWEGSGGIKAQLERCGLYDLINSYLAWAKSRESGGINQPPPR